MIKNYLNAIFRAGIATVLFGQVALAQHYEPLIVTSGFNADVIANGAGPAVSKTTAAVDDASAPGAGYAYLSRDFLATPTSAPLTYGLPVNGIMGSAVAATSGMQFKLHDYDANNALRLPATNDSGTIVFSNTLAAKKLYVSATSGSGAGTVTIRVNFTDATSQIFPGISIADWYGGTNFIIHGIGRVNRATNAVEAGTTSGPRIYQIGLDIDAANQGKQVQSITVIKTSTGSGGIVNVFGATADLSGITCDMPTAVTAVPTSATGGSVSWTAAAGAASYEYHYSRDNIMPAMSFTGTPVTGTSVVLSSIAGGGGQVYVWVRSVCGASNKSAWAASSFSLPTTTPAPWVEGFATTTLPAGWSQTGFTISTTGSGTPSSNTIYKNVYGTGTNATGTFSTINVGTLSGTEDLTFDYRTSNWSGGGAPAADAGYFKVSVSTDFGATYTQIDSVVYGGNNNWNSLSYPLAAYTGNFVSVKIEAVRNSAVTSDIYLNFDNFYIGAPITCFEPTALSSANISYDAASISWTAPTPAPANGYEYYYSTTNTAPTTATLANGTTAAGVTTATINGLNTNTTYYVWVRSVCSTTEKSLWSNSGTFTTQLATPSPWTEGFASTTTPNGFNTSGWTIGSLRGVTGYPGNNIYKNLYASATSGTFSTINVGPILAGDILSFDFKTSIFTAPYNAIAAGSAYFKVSISTDYGVTYNQIDSVPAATINAWIAKNYLLTAYVGQVIKVKIDANRTAEDFDMAFDNLYIGTPPSCYMPTAITINSVTYNSVNVNWSAPAVAPANGYEYYYSTTNTAPTASTAPLGSTAAGITTANIGSLSPTTTYYIWFRSNCGTGNTSAWTPSFTFTTPASCLVPTAVVNSNVTSNSATIAWTAPSAAPANGYEYYYSTSNTVPTSSTIASGSTLAGVTTVNLGSLTSATQYYVWVRSNCGTANLSDWTATSTFTTSCLSTTVPYTQNFESVTVPALPLCTQVQTTGSSNNWVTSSEAGYGFTGKFLRYTYNTSNAANSWFYTQGIELTAGTAYRIKYNYGSTGNTFPEKLKVAYGASANAAAMTNLLADYPSVINSTPNLAEVDFIPSTTGIYYFGFHAYSNANQYYLYVDNINVDLAPSCLAPTALTVPSVTSSGATIAWTASLVAPANGYEYYYSTSNTAPTATSTPNGSTGAGVTTANLNTLTASTTYYVWVRANCGATDKSSWSVSATFTTPCASTTVPYLEDFESATGTSLPMCTTQENLGSGNNWITENFTTASGGFTSRVLKYTYNSTYAANAWFYTRGIQLTAGTIYEISYQYGSNTTGYVEKLKVAYGTAPAATAMTTVLHDHPNVSHAKRDTTIYFSPTTSGVYYFGYHAYSASNQYNIHIDDIRVQVAPTCFAPTALTATAPTINGATLGWTAPSLGTVGSGYEYYTSTSNTAPTGTTTPTGSVAATVNSATINTLNAATTYHYWVRSSCTSTDKSSWKYGGSFTTLCNAYTVPFVENFNAGSMPICWSNSNNTNSTTANLLWKFSGSMDASYGASGNGGKTAGTFAWVDASSPYDLGDSVILTSPLINLTGLVVPSVGFDWFKRHASTSSGGVSTYNNNRLSLDIKSGSGAWTTLFTDSSNATTWRAVDINIPASYHGQSVQFRFVVNKNTNGNGYFYDDLGVDSFRVGNAPCTAPVVALGADTTICVGSSLVLDAGTQAANASYLWSTNATSQTITVTTAGTYTVTVTNGACVTSDTIEVMVAALPVVNLGADTTICAGNTLILEAGNPGSTYVWNNASTNATLDATSTGTYYVTVTSANGCVSSDTLQLVVKALPTVDGIIVDNTASPSISFSPDNAQNGDTYSWDFGDGSPSANGANVTHSYPAAGANDVTYDVMLVVTNDCGSDTAIVQVTVRGTSINKLELDANTLKLYPNPASHNVKLVNESNFKMKHVKVSNMLGQTMLSIPVKDNKQEHIDVSSLSSGVYNVHVEFENGVVIRKLEIIK